MIHGLRKKVVIEEEGRVEIKSPELHRGDQVEVIVLVNPKEDETEYLLSTESNRLHIKEAVEQLKDKISYVYVDPDKL